MTGKIYISQLAHAINDMHRMKLVHRDVKPDNVFMTRNPKTDEIEGKTGDYGTARLVNENNEFTMELTESINTTTVGSGFYISPEMME